MTNKCSKCGFDPEKSTAPYGCDCDRDDPLVEALAAYAHDAWAHWMEYLFDRLFQDREIHPEDRDRWYRQAQTQYANLPEKEKQSDRRQAHRILQVLRERGFDPERYKAVAEAARVALSACRMVNVDPLGTMKELDALDDLEAALVELDGSQPMVLRPREEYFDDPLPDSEPPVRFNGGMAVPMRRIKENDDG